MAPQVELNIDDIPASKALDRIIAKSDAATRSQSKFAGALKGTQAGIQTFGKSTGLAGEQIEKVGMAAQTAGNFLGGAFYGDIVSLGIQFVKFAQNTELTAAAMGKAVGAAALFAGKLGIIGAGVYSLNAIFQDLTKTLNDLGENRWGLKLLEASIFANEAIIEQREELKKLAAEDRKRLEQINKADQARKARGIQEQEALKREELMKDVAEDRERVNEEIRIRAVKEVVAKQNLEATERQLFILEDKRNRAIEKMQNMQGPILEIEKAKVEYKKELVKLEAELAVNNERRLELEQQQQRELEKAKEEADQKARERLRQLSDDLIDDARRQVNWVLKIAAEKKKAHNAGLAQIAEEKKKREEASKEATKKLAEELGPQGQRGMGAAGRAGIAAPGAAGALGPAPVAPQAPQGPVWGFGPLGSRPGVGGQPGVPGGFPAFGGTPQFRERRAGERTAERRAAFEAAGSPAEAIFAQTDRQQAERDARRKAIEKREQELGGKQSLTRQERRKAVAQVGPEEVNAELKRQTDAIIEEAALKGGFEKKIVDALKESTSNLVDHNNKLAIHDQQIDQVLQLLGVVKTKQRPRGQKVGP